MKKLLKYILPNSNAGYLSQASHLDSLSSTIKLVEKECRKPRVSSVIEIGDVAYVAQDRPKYLFRLTDTAELDALTIFNDEGLPITCETAKNMLDDYRKRDDVFSTDFLTSILVVTAGQTLSEDVLHLFGSWGCRTVFLVARAEPPLLGGPYLYSSRGIFHAWRLYADTQEAFIMSTTPLQDDVDTYQPLNASAYGAHSLCVAVPSRLYYKATATKPLAGLRIGIKDIFHLKGVCTGGGNRAYRSLYPPLPHSSDSVQKLLDQGAIVVGKTKTAEFGGSQEVIGDWSDYSYAINPRADGYLVATGSSTGSGAAIAAYPWLDITLGTDAGGSIRDPATANGVYGFRPSHNGSEEGRAIVPCPIFQRSGFFARSTALMESFGRCWFTEQLFSRLDRVPNRIILPIEYHSQHKDVQAMVEKFSSAMSDQLNADLQHISIEDQWSSTMSSYSSTSFFDYFKYTFIDTLSNDYWLHAATFRADYHKINHSKPYVSPNTQWLWAYGSSITPERKASALKEVNIHNAWFTEHVMRAHDDKVNTIMIVPRVDKRYRDEYLPPPTERDFSGFDSNLHASLAGLPNILVPIGQHSFISPVSGAKEVFPISASITGLKGTDVSLIELVHKFSPKCGVSNSVMTGKSGFEVKE